MDEKADRERRARNERWLKEQEPNDLVNMFLSGCATGFATGAALVWWLFMP